MVCSLGKTSLLRLKSKFQLVVSSKENIMALGILIDSDLKWGLIAYKKIPSKCRAFVFSLKFLRKYLSLKEIVEVFKCQVLSTINYAVPVWSGLIGFQFKAKLSLLTIY